jgi:branched-chain amino acid transport system substrate-binding protein
MKSFTTTSGCKAALLALALSACSADAGGHARGDVIRVGTFIDDINGADEVLAAREINAAGGVRIGGKDYKLELVRVLQGETPMSAVKAVNSLVAQGCVAALGPRWSSVTLGNEPDHSDGAARAAFDQNLLLMSGFTSAAAISDLDDDDMMWRTMPSDNFQGSASARFAFETKSARRASILYRDDVWGRGLAATFTAAFRELGGELLAQAPFDPAGDLDRYAFPELGPVFEGQPDIVYIAAFNEISQISNRIVQGGYLKGKSGDAPQFLAADGANSGEILTNGAPEVLARLSGTVPAPPPEDPIFARFEAAYEHAGFGPGSDAWPFTYDGLYLLALAMQAADSSDPRAFRRQLRAISRDDGGDLEVQPGGWAKAKQALLEGRGIDYTGASGPIDFTEQGDPSRGTYSIWRIVRGLDDAYHFEDFDSAEYAVH